MIFIGNYEFVFHLLTLDIFYSFQWLKVQSPGSTSLFTVSITPVNGKHNLFMRPIQMSD